MEEKRKTPAPVALAKTTVFDGVLKFSEAVCIQGKFTGIIDATGDLIVDKDASVKAERITVSSLTVYGAVTGDIFAGNKVDICAGAEVTGDIRARRLRIADGVHYEGQCAMVDAGKEIDIFSRTNEELKMELQS